MLIIRTWRIHTRMFHAKMVVNFPLVDGCSGLRDKLRPPQVTIPRGCAVDGELQTQFRGVVGGVLVGFGSRQVMRHGLGAVNIVLIWAGLGCPTP